MKFLICFFFYITPLQLAIGKRKAGLVKLLLDTKKVDFNAERYFRCDMDILALLLDYVGYSITPKE